MFTLKPISQASKENALAKAERYRLLGEPNEAESICLDILEIDPANRQARISLILALTDEIPHDGGSFARALEAIPALTSPYDRAYYFGIAWERRAKAAWAAGGHRPCSHLYDWIVKALGFFEEAERLRPAGNDASILRWNACVRFLNHHRELAPAAEEAREPILSE